MTTAATPKGERRRQALVESAAELILEGGIDAVRHRAVANRAGLPLASTTYYFESLDELVVCAFEHNSHQELDSMRARVEEVAPLQRSLESTAELIVDLLVGPRRAGELEREQLISRYERCVATARHPELRDVQLHARRTVDDLLADLLERCGRRIEPTGIRRLVAAVDGSVLGALGELDPDPRGLARGILLDVVGSVAPPTEHDP
ncbi:MAG: TetR family transcriptional regulator [Rhodococcus sp. (in: high G+C Gram-positive bacteria)]|uniref:TetR/AcrR family transcriptional regulator n=1 Tax=Rhodococcus sp. TaxID=1831 RepID=UPI003BB7F5F1